MGIRQVRSRIIPLVALFTLLSSSVPAFAQGGGFSIRPIVRRGDPVGDGGRFFDCDVCEGRVIGFHALNNRGDVAIAADVVSGTCFSNQFLISGGKVIRLADFCHPTEFGRLTLLGQSNVNDHGEAVTLAGITVNNRIVPMLLKHFEGQLTKIVQEGDVSPIGTIFQGCGFGEPAINDGGDVAFFACGETTEGVFSGDGVFRYSEDKITKVAVSGDPSPIGGEFALNFIPAQAVRMNNRGEILFRGGVILAPTVKEKVGMFLTTNDGIKKIVVDGDPMPTGGIVTPDTFAHGDLNDKSEVAFVVGITGGPTRSGIFLYSNGEIVKIMAAGEATPVGGVFAQQGGLPISVVTPKLNDNSAVAFSVPVSGGSTPSAIFLGSPRGIIKVVAIGDQLPTGETIREINSFALNDLGEVAFFAFGKKGQRKPLGVFLATPLTPVITSVKLKQKPQGLELRVNGTAMITNDSLVEVNGVAVDQISYPEGFRENGGTTTRVVSRDPRLAELIKPSQPVEITVFNPLTNRRSAPLTFAR